METYNQVAALPFREGQDLEICLITSRETGRWVLPKGWPKAGVADDEMAAVEAIEEAGLVGTLLPGSIGSYSYTKKLHTFAQVTCVVEIFPLRVTDMLSEWPEQDQRRRQWASPEDAAKMVDEPELAAILKGFKQTLYAGSDK